MEVRLTTPAMLGALVLLLAAWMLHSFLPALLVACVTAVASWPLYRRFAALLRSRMPRGAISLAFTFLMAVLVLAPLIFACWALLAKASELFLDVVAADKKGIGVPPWLESVPLAGPSLAEHWRSELTHPGALWAWAQQRADPAALLGWIEGLGQFMGRQLVIIGFAVLVLFFLYQEGESLARGLRRALGHLVGERAEAYVDVATQAVRASANSMLVVALFDGLAGGIAYAIIGVPQPVTWAAITGLLAVVPFVGYGAVAALTLELAMTGASTAALLSLAFGCGILFFGDKIVRPLAAREGTHLGFVWVLMGCLGGFQALGLVGVVIGPVVLTLARELWAERVRLAATPVRASRRALRGKPLQTP
jgi:predicted PurR-regulated permease PerM